MRIRSAADVDTLLRGARGLIGMRLHAAALGWMYGIPTLGLGYRLKTKDFAAFLDASDQVVDLRRASAAELEEAAVAVVDRPHAAIERPHERALEAKGRLDALLAEINRQVARPASG